MEGFDPKIWRGAPYGQSMESVSVEDDDAVEVEWACLGSSGIQSLADMVRRTAVPDDG